MDSLIPHNSLARMCLDQMKTKSNVPVLSCEESFQHILCYNENQRKVSAIGNVIANRFSLTAVHKCPK